MVVIENNRLNTKQITRADWEDVARFIHSDAPVHRHLGWRSPLDWLDHQPFLGAVRDEELVGVLACPPNEDFITWLRLLAVAKREEPREVWTMLWPAARRVLRDEGGVSSVNVLAMHTWIRDLLRGSGFQRTYNVVVMEWDVERAVFPEAETGIEVRPMGAGDIQGVYSVDRAAFDPLWRNSQQGLRVAHDVSRIAAVAEKGGKIVGYQISTADSLGGHLARLAVHPQHQGQGVGTALVADVLRKFEEQGLVRVSVNTQEDNVGSLRLYEKFGFEPKAESFPVYQHFL